MVRVRELPVDENFSLRGKTLDEYIQADKKNGLIPFFVSRKSSSTSSFNDLILGIRNVGYNVMLFI